MTALALLGLSIAGVLVFGVVVVVLIGKRAHENRVTDDAYRRAGTIASQNLRYAQTHPQCTASRNSTVYTHDEMRQAYNDGYGRRQTPFGVERIAVPEKHETAVRDSKGEVAYDVTDRWPRKGKLVKR
ncbi:MAG: hypothetical protein KAJ55_04675 [Anaerolineales bacterium]|nr:hypothetical protein [Anaerolineales bacterium]